MTNRRLLRLALAPPLGIAFYALASHVALLAGRPLPTNLLPFAFALGCGLALFVAPSDTPPAPDSDARIWKLIPWLVALFLVVLLGAVSYGAVATTDREWDGLVSWSLRARYLAPPADLSQPFFHDPAVYAHSLGYPLLQPLCLGGCQALVGDSMGRLFFPAVFLAFLALVAAVARQRGLPRGHGWLMVLAFAATPMWYSTGSGAVDSGYAELLLAYFLAVAATGLITRRAILVASAAFCLPLIKPEGLPYALLLTLVTGLGSTTQERPRQLHGAATAGLVLAALVWLPLQARLLGQAPGALVFCLPLGLGLGLCGLREVQIRVGPRPRTWLLLGGSAGISVALILVVQGAQEFGSPLLREVAGSLVELPGRLVDLPAVIKGCLQGFVFVRKFGLLFPMLLCLLCFRRSWTRDAPHRPTAGFFLGGIAIACAAIFMGADTDWDHVFKSRFDRLLLQWVGVGWLLLGPWLSEWFRAPIRPESGPSPTSAAKAS
jgi:hypothetical protein